MEKSEYLRVKRSNIPERRDPFAGVTKPSHGFPGNRTRDDRQIPTPRELGIRFRALRGQLGLSKADVARRCAVTEQEITELEARGEVSLETLLALARGMSGTTDLRRLFLLPRFRDISEVVEHARRAAR